MNDGEREFERKRRTCMTRAQLLEIKVFFRERGELARRMKAEAERKYREEHSLREPTGREIALLEQGKLRNGAGWSNGDGIAWNYPPEIYERMNQVCFTRIPKRIWNILGRPENLYESDEEYHRFFFPRY